MPSETHSIDRNYVSPGMPPLKLSSKRGKTVSFFEFWPSWLMYIPVVLQWLVLAIRYRSLTLPLIANPRLPLSGMVGVGKSELLQQATAELDQTVLKWFTHTKSSNSLIQQCTELELKMAEKGFNYPMVCKPDIGCRGSGVKLIKDQNQLHRCLEAYPVGANIFVQRLADYEPEAGIFYVRNPKDINGNIISMALKYTPYVLGDGVRTLGQLIQADERAGDLSHLYQARHSEVWDTVIEKNKPYRLIFAASHSRGAVFKDANINITPALSARIDLLMKCIPEFHYGRLDVKFKNMESLEAGLDLQIVEINSASSESLHIWDSNTNFYEAIRSLTFQYRTLYKLGAENRKNNYKTPSLLELLRRWKIEKQLTLQHPETD